MGDVMISATFVSGVAEGGEVEPHATSTTTLFIRWWSGGGGVAPARWRWLKWRPR